MTLFAALLKAREFLTHARVWVARARAVFLGNAPASWVVVASAILGAILAWRVFGVRYLLGTSDFWSWPVGDAAMMVTGWEYYVHEPWHWPLAQTFGTNGAAGTNILYLDTIPLVAFLAKVLHTVVGGHWHPYGLAHFAIYVLQAVFAALLARRVGLKSILGGLAVAMLMISMHAFILRFYHEGLNAQFVILWALLAYLRTTPQRLPLRLAAEWTACVACAILLHPYLGAMNLVIAAAAFARLAASSPRLAACAATVSILAVSSILFVFGYVGQPGTPDPGETGKATMNLMTLAVPYHSHLFPNLGLIQDMTGVQWDGCNFIGFGTWALLATSALFAPRMAGGAFKRHKALLFGLGILALYAPSNRCWAGQTLVWDYDVPALLRPVFVNARATGRFFWPVGFALVIALCALVHRRFPKNGAALLFIAALVQFGDSTACWTIVTNALSAAAERQLAWDTWSRSLEGATRVNMYPSYQCWWPIVEVPDRLLEQERELEFLAASQGLRTNGGRAGRPITNCANELQERNAAAAGELRRGEAYVFFRPAYYSEILSTIGEDHCKEIGDAFICRSDR